MTTPTRFAGRNLKLAFATSVLGLALAAAPGSIAAAKAHTEAKSTSEAKSSDSARDAFNKGDIAHAFTLASQTGERWIGGLAAFRLKQYSDALPRFAALAEDSKQTPGARAAAGFWAARAADALGDSAKADKYLKIAAAAPNTFYGMIAERKLAIASGAEAAKRHVSAAQFPTPELTPQGGFTLGKALVYALVLQESRFNAAARSGGGALGLMQLTPATAARVAGDDKLTRDPSPLREAGFNLRVGQDYVTRLLGALKGDLVRAVAAYNSGPGPVEKLGAKLGDAGDTLMVLESLPASTRDYAQKVMANYWTYRQLMGQASPSLDAAASGAKAILFSADGQG